MRNKYSLLLVCGCAWFGGLCGGWLFAPDENPNPTFESVRVTKNLVVATGEAGGAGCRLLPDGTLTATSGILANQVRAQSVSAQSIFASTNPLIASFDQQEILAQLVADPNSGGRIVVLNRAATLVPSQGPPQHGQATCIRFHPDNGRPEIFTHDLALGEEGKSFMLGMRPTTLTADARSTDAAATKVR